ncbi:MAG: hypothetical protein WC749_12725 [Dehalococcoidia bacterium]
MIKTRCPGLSMIAWNWAEGGEDKPEVRKGLGGWIRQPAYWWRRLHFRCLGRGCYQSPIEMADTTDPVATARAACSGKVEIYYPLAGSFLRYLIRGS